MDLRSGMVLPEQRDCCLPGSWMPATPAKPVLNKVAAAAGGQGGHAAALTNWLKSAADFSDGATRLKGSEGGVGLNGGEAAAVAAPENCAPSSNANVTMQAKSSLGGSAGGWHRFLYTNRTMHLNAATASGDAMASFPVFIDGSPIHTGEKSGSQLLLNGKVTLSSDLLNSTTQSRSAACETVPSPFTPVTPEKYKAAQDGGHTGSGGSMDEGRTVWKGLGEASNLSTFAPKGRGPIQLSFDKGIVEQADFMPLGLLSQLQENTTQEEAERQGIDLNKTPQQKPRRRKHRPKVVKEGKSSRTPKSSTPKPATPNPAMTSENVSTKRKYVRRKGLNSPLETPSSAVAGENVELDKRKGRKSAKRHLDFSAEDDKAAETFQCTTNSRSKEQVEPLLGNNTSYSTGNSSRDGISNDVFNRGQEMAVNSSAGLAYLLNHPNNQILDMYLNSLHIPSLHLQPSRRELIRENLKKLASIRDSQQVLSHHSVTESDTQSNHHLTPEQQSKSTSTSNLLSTDESMRRNEQKMDDNHFIDDSQLHTVNVVQADFNCDINWFSKDQRDRNNHLPCFPEIQKKKTEKGQNELEFSDVGSLADAQRILELKKLGAMEGKQAVGQIEAKTMKSLKEPIQACNLASLEDNTKCDQLPIAPRNPNLLDERHRSDITQGPKDYVEALSVDTHANIKTKRRRKKQQTQVVSGMSTRTNQVGLQEQDFTTCILRQKSAWSVSCSASNSDAMLPSSRGNETLHSLDVIIQKMKFLNINWDQGNNVIQEETAIVPYDAHGVIVPFEGQFYPAKRRHRAKIVLDDETNRVWNLLMGKESYDGVEGTEADKEKWWEEERRVFHGRADSFIARMHLVQGDRRFSPWKGSVLDSVIGVFLTQNVSDHLSSSAFMSLAARFPLRSRGGSEEPTRSTEHQASCNVDHYVADKCLDKQVYDLNSVTNHGAKQMEEKEMQSSERNNGGTMLSHSEVKDPVDIRIMVSEDGNIINTDDKKKIELTHSTQTSVVSSQNSSGDPFLAIDQIGSSSEANSEAEYLITGNQISLESRTSFMDLLDMAESSSFRELYIFGNGEPSEAEILNTPSKDNNKHAWLLGKEGLYFPPATEPGINHSSEIGTGNGPLQNAAEDSSCQYSILTSQCSPSGNLQAFTNNLAAQILLAPSMKTTYAKPSCYHDGISGVTTEAPTNNSCHNYSRSHNASSMEILPKQRIASEALSQTQNYRGHQFYSSFPLKETHDVVECSTVVDKDKGVTDKGVESNSMDEICSSSKDPMGSTGSAPRRKRGKLETEKNKSFDWDFLRREVCQNSVKKERSNDAMDSLDWEAVRDADVNEISNTIRERGMNNKLAERIKGFLDRLMKEHGSIDLEWLRDVPPDKAKDYLLSIKGLGLKSVECVRLLTLHHLAFPVDTNVGRICVRLGWVPLQPLPESLQLHLLELYPMLETIQKYLWPRLCTLDQRTLYELHYQMITFGKVFCTKSKPNCNACPMRGECKHFASAFASARLALPGPEEKNLVTSSVGQNQNSFTSEKTLQLEGSSLLQGEHVNNNCEPIIEEPATPEPECTQIADIEDAFYEDPDEIPTIKLNMEEFAQNLQSYMQQNEMDLQNVDLSKALVAITPEAASIPVPKLKNVSRLRTEHQVYELPDSHPLLEGLDQREPQDPCPYLLAIWTPGETAQSTEPPESCCNAQGTGKLCDKRTCFSCNSVLEAQAQTVRGTLLVPCRTAMRGSFPLNGTYFQVNEVFADHESSLNPIDVPRVLIWNLPRRTVYFGTSVPTIFRGLAIEDIQNCFWRGFVCVRGFDRKSRGPRPLMARFHFPASKANRNKRSAVKDD